MSIRPAVRQVMAIVAPMAEVGAGYLTALLVVGVFQDSLGTIGSQSSLAITAALLAFGWLTADRRRLDEETDWLTGLILGSDWVVTTVLFPASLVAFVLFAALPAYGSALIMLSAAFVATAPLFTMIRHIFWIVA